MKLSKHIVMSIVVMLVCALIGLIYLQSRLLMNTVELKETTFKRNVMAAMNYANEKLEEIDARNRFFLSGDSVHLSSRTLQNGDSTFTMTGFRNTAALSGGRLREAGRGSGSVAGRKVIIRTFDLLGGVDTTIVDSAETRALHAVLLPKIKARKGAVFVQVRSDSATSTVRVESGKQSYAYTVTDQDVRKDRIVRRIAESIGEIRPIPIGERFSRELVDSVIALSLRKQGIQLPYEFGMFSNDTLALARTTLTGRELSASEFRLQLMPLEPVPTAETLVLSFPAYKAFMFNAYLPELGATLLLLIIIVACFASTIAIIVRQKDFAERLTDFINNMTHEFKTPLSTIALASEALAKPEIRNSEAKVARYNQIIIDENTRMKNQVEKILQMAALEEGETEFRETPTALHPILARAAENFTLLVKAREGSIALDLGAAHDTILADALHIENVIHNILDNAVKYSPDNPVISIRTTNAEAMVVVEVADHGRGIAKEHVHRIFDKFFRVPTGNLHDVKGFGLGLSYVKLITEAHHGTVSIASEPGKGTTAVLRFPLSDASHESTRD